MKKETYMFNIDTNLKVKKQTRSEASKDKANTQKSIKKINKLSRSIQIVNQIGFQILQKRTLQINHVILRNSKLKETYYIKI